MSLKYRVVLKKDMSKGAAKGARLFYGQVRSNDKIDFKNLCEQVCNYCGAKRGEVERVIDGLLNVLKFLLGNGNIIQVGAFGNFRMLAGSKGSATLKGFDPDLFKKARVVFSPGELLRALIEKPYFDRLEAFTDPEEVAGGEPENPDENPDIL